ncbi:MAG TPA: hypothetical protein VIY56_02955, partial [Vicinamibacterales bacterium]
PLYLKASGGRIPELTRVIVAHQNQIVMEPTLEAGLARLFGPGADRSATTPTQTDNGGAAPAPQPVVPASPGAPSPQTDALAAQAQRHYSRAIEAQRAGDWATYGEEIRQLGATLEKMRGR